MCNPNYTLFSLIIENSLKRDEKNTGSLHHFLECLLLHDNLTLAKKKKRKEINPRKECFFISLHICIYLYAFFKLSDDVIAVTWQRWKCVKRSCYLNATCTLGLVCIEHANDRRLGARVYIIPAANFKLCAWPGKKNGSYVQG